MFKPLFKQSAPRHWGKFPFYLPFFRLQLHRLSSLPPMKPIFALTAPFSTEGSDNIIKLPLLSRSVSEERLINPKPFNKGKAPALHERGNGSANMSLRRSTRLVMDVALPAIPYCFP
jgi:hypothetical protein